MSDKKNEDGFTVKWAGRDEHGNFHLAGDVFEVVVAPSPMFGQNIRDFGFEKAVKMADAEPQSEHDFGACYMKDKSLRKESDGRWYVDISVDPHRARYIKVTTMLVDDAGEPILGEDGKRQVKVGPRKEAWITCELGQLKPRLAHPHCAAYRQRDQRTAAKNAMAARSAKIGVAKEKSARAGKSKGKRTRLSPEQIAALTG